MDPLGTAKIGGRMASGPLRVFLSHTSDLGKPDEHGSFVAAAVAAVLRARHAVTDMAYFAARDVAPAATCVDMVAQSDVYVGVIGLRYGSPVGDRSDVSYTELEFEAAGERGQPRLIFLIREDSGHLPRKRQPAAHRARQDAFRRRLRSSGLVSVRVGSPPELELAIYQALVELAPIPDAPARLAAAQALLASMPTDALPPRAPDLPAGSRMPLAPNPLFVGRGDELLQVARALHGGETTVALGQVVASTGLGGLGKTQLAVELVHRYGRFFAGGVFWLSFANADEVPLQVAACAAPELAERPLEERVQRVRDAWQGAVPRLLVFDNCEEEALLDAWRPASGGCRVLVTSRRSHWSPTLGVTTFPLDLLPRPDSVELLRRYRPDLAADDHGLDAIAEELGDLPLALHLAGVTCTRTAPRSASTATWRSCGGPRLSSTRRCWARASTTRRRRRTTCRASPRPSRSAWAAWTESARSIGSRSRCWRGWRAWRRASRCRATCSRRRWRMWSRGCGRMGCDGCLRLACWRRARAGCGCTDSWRSL